MQEIIRQRRSIRRFARKSVPLCVIHDALEAACLAPTGSNSQPLRFIAVHTPALCEAVFAHLKWAGHIPDGSASPSLDTQPAAYVLLLIDRSIREQADNDAGAAAMSIMLSCQAQGVASCWLGAIDRPAIMASLSLDAQRFKLHTVIALGYAAQSSRPVAMENNSIAYYLEAPDCLCVPKRDPADITQVL